MNCINYIAGKLRLQREYYLVEKMFHAITSTVQVPGVEEECVTKGVDTTFSLGDEIVDVAQTTRFGHNKILNDVSLTEGLFYTSYIGLKYKDIENLQNGISNSAASCCTHFQFS